MSLIVIERTTGRRWGLLFLPLALAALGWLALGGLISHAQEDQPASPRARFFAPEDQPSFATARFFELLANETSGLALGDVDNDGDLDIAAVNKRERNAIYFNDGQGNFAQRQEFARESVGKAAAVALGDVNGDGWLDIAVGNEGGQNYVYLNNGQGNFDPIQWLRTRNDLLRQSAVNQQSAQTTAALADVEQALGAMPFVRSPSASKNIQAGQPITDARALNALALAPELTLDALTLQALDARQLNQLLVDSRRRFGPGADATKAVALGDLDRDGDLDLVVGNSKQRSRVYRNDGDGNFDWARAEQVFGPASDTRSVALAHMNRDDALDIVVGNWGEPNAVFLNDGAGRFDWPGSERGFGGNENTRGIALGDLDGDRDLDVVVGNTGLGSTGQHNIAYLNDGAGNLGVGEGSQFGGDFDQGASIALGDVDGDGDLDAVVGNVNDTWNYVYLNDGAGGFGDGERVAFGVETNSTFSLALGDLNRDGALDIAAGNLRQPDVVYLNAGLSRFDRPGSQRPFGATADRTMSVALGDVDGNGALDIIASNLGVSNSNALYLNDGQGRFDWAGSQRLFGLAGENGDRSLAVGDLDGDGTLDVVVGNFGQPSAVYLNDGRGNFDWPDAERPLGAAAAIKSLALGDVDNDGDLDIVAGRIGAPSAVHLNDGAANFDQRSFGPAQSRAESMALGDVDGDGDLDIALGNWEEQNLVYLNDGAGNFAWIGNERLFGTGKDATTSLALGDLNRDGALDIAVGNESQLNVVYLNDGRGNFDWAGSARPFGTGVDVTKGLALADLNRDGVLDIVVANNGKSPSAAYLNDGQGNFDWPGAALKLGRTPGPAFALALGDMNEDGAVDVVLGNSGQQSAVYLNAPAATAALANTPPAVVLARPGRAADAGLYSTPEILDQRYITVAYRLADAEGDPVRFVRAFYSVDGGGQWQPAVPALAAAGLDMLRFSANGLEVDTHNLATDGAADHLFTWDTFASGFFGQSDNVIMRLEAHPGGGGLPPGGQATVAGQTTPFRVRGTQVRVFSETTAISNTVAGAFVYRLPAGQTRGAKAMSSGGALMRTDPNGYLPGRGELRARQADQAGDRLIALLPTQIVTSHFSAQLYVSPNRYPISVTQGLELDSPIIVPDAKHIGSISVWISLTHGLTGDLAVDLVSPMGASARLLTSTAELRGQRIDKTVDDAALLAPFVGEMAQGLWTLRVSNASSETLSALNTWALLLRLSPLFYTSAAPSPAGLEASEVISPGVQALTVTAQNPLLLFDLDVALEWDARNDPQYTAQLEFDLKRASEYLYDWTNGQVTLGQVNVYHDAKRSGAAFAGRAPWQDGQIRIFASNRLRPNANQGGIVTQVISDPLTSTVAYAPGQVRIGATWNRFGENRGSLGEDWPRILAHELGHYLLFLDDNYLRLDEEGLLAPERNCSGAMADPYRDDDAQGYGELHADDAGWQQNCQDTLSQRHTGRADWETITAFYPWLQAHAPVSGVIPGPEGLPLDVTQVNFIGPMTATQALEMPLFYLADMDGPVQAGRNARAFLFSNDFEAKDNWLIDLGRPRLDQVLARGAQPGDWLCVVDPAAGRRACQQVRSTNGETIALQTDGDWQPDIALSPETSRTLRIAVTGVPASAAALKARLYPTDFPAPLAITLTRQADGSYAGVFPLDAPALSGHVHIWRDPQHFAVTDFALGGNPAFMRSMAGFAFMRSMAGFAFMRSMAGFAFMRSMAGFGPSMAAYAPAVSSDGQAILYGEDLKFAQGQFVTLQAATAAPNLPGWASVVGNAYRLMASSPDIDLGNSVLSFAYLDGEVPPGEEQWLRIYRYGDAQWQPLPTQLDTYTNYASARIPGPGLYALLSSFQVPLDQPGWNLISYPVADSRPISQALQSIAGQYGAVYHYDPRDKADPWKVYDPSAPGWANDLQAMEFGKGYLVDITASSPITLLLKGVAQSPHPDQNAWQPSAGQAVQDTGLETPPATYYGPVLPGPGFTPAPDLPIIAWVDNHICGMSTTSLDEQGQVVYTIKVLAAGAGLATGCGVPGKTVVFKVGPRFMLAPAPWDNNRPQRHELSPTL